jgi:hypothetical protein
MPLKNVLLMIPNPADHHRLPHLTSTMFPRLSATQPLTFLIPLTTLGLTWNLLLITVLDLLRTASLSRSALAMHGRSLPPAGLLAPIKSILANQSTILMTNLPCGPHLPVLGPMAPMIPRGQSLLRGANCIPTTG